MKNKTTTYKWAYLPFVFSSAAILATQVTAAPTGQSYQDAKQVNSINHEYVGGTSQIGFGVDDEGNIDAEFNQVLSESDNHSTGVGLWAGYDLKGDDKGIQGRGGQINHAWVSRDKSGRASHVNKAFAAYDRNAAGNERATVGYGQENENLFWDGRVSKGLGGGTGKRTVNGQTVTDRAYDWGVGATVGKFLPNANARIRAGIDHEWSDKVGSGEKDARNTTLSAGIEKFFQGTGHSVSLDVAGSKNSGGARFNNDDDTNFTGRLGYKYDFGGASIYQPDRRYRRVRVEVPGQAVAPRYAQKQQYKKVPTYKTVPTYKNVPVYGNKQVRVPTKQLVKSTMELEGQTFFKYGSYKLIPSAQTRLKQIAAQIRKTGYKGSIRITGNTCGLSNARYDKILSEKRANAVKQFLVANGFNPNHMITRGLGKNHPKYAKTPDQDFKNRRVDIEYVTEQKTVKTGYRTENKRVQTGTRKVQSGSRQVATGFKNVPAGMKNVMISNGRPGAPRVIWKTEAIPTSPAWIKRALHNNIQHDRGVNTYTTTFGNEGPTAPQNTGPVATNDSTKTECGSPVSINVLGNDTDADGDSLTITSFTQPANGTVTRGANGTLIYTPNAGAACGVDDSFSYTISDGNGGTSTATATVSIDAEAPEAQNDSATTSAGTAVTLDVLGNDTTNSGSGQLTITSVGNPSNGSAQIVNGQIVYTPNAGFSGTDSFTYTITDSNGETATATATITVNGPDNVVPVAQNDAATTSQGTAVALNVLGNDTSNSGSGQLTITSVGNPQNGSASIVNGQIVYTPNAGFIGTDIFSYTITDSNGETATATATVTVNGPDNVAPVAQNDAATTPEGTAVTLNVLGNDTSNSGSNQLTIINVADPSNGSATIVNGQIVYTPNAGFVGTDSFTYTVRDSNGLTTSATATVTVEGDVKPDAQNDSATTPEGTPVTLSVLGNDTSNSGSGELTITSVGDPQNGTAEIIAGEIVYTPNDGFDGTDSFTYTITDSNGETATATATVTVTDDPKPVAQNDSATTPEGTAVTLEVLDNDTSNSGSGQLTISSVGNPQNGSAAIVNGAIVYTPNAGFDGTDSFTYTITNSNGDTATATATVTVTDDPKPVAQNDSASTPFGEAVTLPVLSNDTTNSGSGQLTISSVGNPQNGSAQIVNGQIVYTPNAGFSGQDSFTYTITDSNGETATATATVNVGEAPKPVAQNDSATTPFGEAVTLPVLGNDTTNSGSGQLTITSVGNPSNGSAQIVNGEIVYTPNAGFSGQDSFSYTITDSNGETATATAAVNVGDAPKPVAQNDSAKTPSATAVSISVLGNDSTNSGSGQLTISNVGNPGNGTAMISGSQIVYTPDAGFAGTDSFTYTITDSNGEMATATATVIVEEGNKAPDAKNNSVSTGCAPITIDVLGNDTDPDGDSLSIMSVDFSSLQFGTAMQSGNQIIYQPSNTCGKGNTGVDNFSYTISDGNGNTDSANVKVTVKGVTDGGNTQANADDILITEGEKITINVLANDNGKGLRIIKVDNPKNGHAVIRNNKIVYTPNAGFTGMDMFYYDIVDANGYNDSSSIIVDVIKSGTKSN